MWSRLEGYLLVPHELLHVLGYRLVGKRCHYRWGDRYVVAPGPMARRERLVGLLFPFAVCIMLWLLLLPLPFIGFFLFKNMVVAIGLSIIAMLPLGYAFTSLGDFRHVYWLLSNKPKGSKTPFDLLFWPITEEDILGVRRSALIILIVLGVLYLSFLAFFPT